MNNKKIIKGNKGKGGGSSKQYIPKEDENTLIANSYANLVDLLCEGEIGGPANNNSWTKSTYLNEIPIQNDDDSYNFEGVTLTGRTGTSSQSYMPGFNGVENTSSVNSDVTIAGGAITRTITSSDVDDLKVTISIPAMLSQNDKGDLLKTTLKLKVSVTPDNGAGSKQTVVDPNGAGRIYGKCITEYRKQFVIKDLAQYGNAPWVVTVERITADSGSAKLVNAFKWFSYTTVIQTKLRYYDRSVVGLTIDSSSFGTEIPTRAYRINGRKIKIPDNYNPVSRTYTGDWNGTFSTGTCNNPAWVIYDLLTDPEIGLGQIIEESMVDKWTLYSCAQYCDELITVSNRDKQSDGSYVDTTSSEHRFSFDGVIENRTQAMEVITNLSAVMRAYPMWTAGQISFVQDKPINSPARPVGLSNVSEDGFAYQGIPKRDRHSVVKVSWNDPEKLGRLTVDEIVDEESIIDLGYNEMDFAAFGCVSRTEAIRRGNYVLDTDINSRETVSFTGGLEWADAIPGTLIAIQDPNYASTILEGRIKSGTTTSLVLDKEIELESGVTYTMLIQWAEGDAETRELTNSPATTDTFTWTVPLADIPFEGAQLVLSATNLETRKFVIVSVTEDNSFYNIMGVEYDPNKYARIEEGVVGEVPISTALLPSILEPPTGLVLESYSYTEGDQDIRKYGIQISWVHSIDPRTTQYELRYKPADAGWINLNTTAENSYDWAPVSSDDYDISVRAVGVGIFSTWLTVSDYNITAELSQLEAPTGLDTEEGSGLWSGRDCVIEWNASTGSVYDSTSNVIFETAEVGDSNVSHYAVEVREVGTTLVSTYQVPKDELRFVYTYADNVSQNTSPMRSILFYVYTVDFNGDASSGYATLTATNPAPDMSGITPVATNGPTYINVDWSVPTDTDMDYYKVYWDTSNPPTANSQIVTHPTNWIDVAGLDFGTTYYFKIEPYDLFGVGTATGGISGSPTQIPAEDVDIELSASIIITDEDSNTPTTLAKLYDGVFDTDGVTYTGGWKWIQYDLGVENFINGIQIWTAGAYQVHISYKREEGDSWSWLSGNATHGLDTVDGQDRLVSRASEALAQTNYWTTSAGFNYAFFPNGEVARYCRLHINASSSTIYELVFRRIVIAEDISVESLSAITADIGNITTGVIQASSYPTSGIKIDIDSGEIVGTMTFKSGTTGIAQTDAGALAQEDTADWSTQVAGTGKPDNNADVTSANTAANITGQGDLATQDTVGATDCDTTIISGGKVITSLLTASNIQTGTLDAGLVTIESDDGKTVFTGDTITIRDTSNVLRVKLGDLS